MATPTLRPRLAIQRVPLNAAEGQGMCDAIDGPARAPSPCDAPAPAPSKREVAVLRQNIERFVDGLLDEAAPHPLAALLNSSFSFDMLELLFKRMTPRLSAMVFSPARSMEFLEIAMNAALPTHTRALATAFLVRGNAVTGFAACEPDAHSCEAIWELIFGALQREARGEASPNVSPNASTRADVKATAPTQGGTAQAPASGNGSSNGTSKTDSYRHATSSRARTAAACAHAGGAIELEDLEEVIRDEVSHIEREGALERQASLLHEVAERAQRHAELVELEDGHDSDDTAVESPRSAPRSPTSLPWTPRSSSFAFGSVCDGESEADAEADLDAELESVASDTGTALSELGQMSTPLPSPAGSDLMQRCSADAACSLSVLIPPAPTSGSISPLCMGLYGADSANFTSQLVRYFALNRQKGYCILRYLTEHPAIVDLLVANVGQDDTRTMLLHLVYADHSDVAIRALFRTHLIDKMIQRLITSKPPRDAYARDCIENAFLLLREIVQAPYLTPRGVAISAKIVPFDKYSGGQDCYVSICGAARDTTQASTRKFTSRKVRHIVHLFMAHNQLRLERLFAQMIKELTFWSSPAEGVGERRDVGLQMQSIESLSLLDAGHPRAACTTMLMHLFELTETVELNESPSSSDAAAPSVGIDCLKFSCVTHLVRSDRVLWMQRSPNHCTHPQSCVLGVNCILGLQISDENPRIGASPLLSAPLDEIVSVARNSWHPYGFAITITKTTRPTTNGKNKGEATPTQETRIEYFAAASNDELDQWMTTLEEVIRGDLAALETFCHDDWRSHAREYRRLRECLIVAMERRGYELFSFLRQVIVLNTRHASTYHLLTIVKFLYAVLSNESKRIDQLFVSAQLLAVLLTCYEKYPNLSLLLSEITKMVTFCLYDFKSKRSPRCPLVGRLFLSEGKHARLCPLLTKVFVGTNGGRDSKLAGTDALAHLQVIMEAIRVCCREPKTSSQVRVQDLVQHDDAWQRVLLAFEAAEAKSPERSITSKPVQPEINRTDISPSLPAFQEHIINQLTRPTYSMLYGLGSSFLMGDGCAFGFLLKQRGDGSWRRVLLVFENLSSRLWFFHPTGHDDAANLPWKWVIPRDVKTRFTRGQDNDTHSSIGHHGLFIDAYDPSMMQDNSKAKTVTRELHFSVTKLEDRDQWLEVLATAAAKVQQQTAKFDALCERLRAVNRKDLVQCAQCHEKFKVFRRPHSCKRCGQWFCNKCTSKRLPMPEVGRLKPARHCQHCYDLHNTDPALDARPFRLLNANMRSNSRRGSITSEHDGLNENGRSTFCNPELDELSRGMVSSRTLLQLRRRMNRSDSIESPTAKLQIDEVDNFFFAEDYEVEVIPSSPPGSPTMWSSVDGLLFPPGFPSNADLMVSDDDDDDHIDDKRVW